MSWSTIRITEAAPHERRSHSPGTGVLAQWWHRLRFWVTVLRSPVMRVVPGPALGRTRAKCCTWTWVLGMWLLPPEMCSRCAKPTPAFEDFKCVSQQRLCWLLAEMTVFWTHWVKQHSPSKSTSLFFFLTWPWKHLKLPLWLIRPPWGLSSKEFTRKVGHGFDPWVRKILWKREWQPPPVFLPGKSHGHRSLTGYTSRGEELDTT